MISMPLLLTLAMQCSPAVHPDTITDVARAESGFNPYAIGVVGGASIYPKDINEAIAHVARLKAQGKNFSIGLMQINQSNFRTYNKTPRELFNPCTNLSVFEKIMTACYIRGGTLKRALSCYYSGNFNAGQEPEKRFNGTSYTERIGYTVPSTTEDQRHFKSSVDDNKKVAPVIKWPDLVVRGDLMPSPEISTHHIKYPSRIVRGSLSI